MQLNPWKEIEETGMIVWVFVMRRDDMEDGGEGICY